MTYSWHPDKPDVPLDRFNHCCDALRYGVTAIDPQGIVPVEARVVGADEWWSDEQASVRFLRQSINFKD